MPTSLPKNPFAEIALCLSGGGYRAAAFHLGSMSYLHRLRLDGKPLLHHVKAISTVSGGTFTGVLYALMTQEGKDFEEIYGEIVQKLRDHDLVKEALKKLRDKDWDNPNKKQNLINAFSEIYNKLLTHNATFSSLTNERNTHLDLVAFNSTEFTQGLNFRFQTEWKDKRQVGTISRGSQGCRLSQAEQNEIRLADVIAASSCFPGGFEPIGFPHDFVHDNSPLLKKMQSEVKFSSAIGLMDGGIYDNQGIDSIQISESRRSGSDNERNPYDLLIISDVSSSGISDPFSFHNTMDRKVSKYSYSLLQKKVLNYDRFVMGLGLVMLLVGLILLIKTSLGDSTLTGIGFCIGIIGSIVLLFRMMIKQKLQEFKSGLGSFVEKEISPFYLHQLYNLNLREYKIRDLEPLMIDRINSVILMVKDIFLKQVRRLKYRSIYEDPLYNNRKISNLITKLKRSEWKRTKLFQDLEVTPTILQGDYRKVVGPKIEKVVEEAANFGTTLWFTPDDQIKETIDKLLGSGQITMCFTIMIYISEIVSSPDYASYSEEIKTSIDEIMEQCLVDWKIFKKDPLKFVSLS